MGKVIADIITGRDDCKVVGGIDKVADSGADFPIVATAAELPVKPEVIIDFSHPSTLDGLLDYCQTNGVPIVIATTGYSEEQIAKIKKAAELIPVFFTFNMSLGINLLAELAKKAAAVLEGQFDIMLGNAINEVLEQKCEYVYDRHSVRAKRSKTEIGMHSVRGGTIVGEHEIIFAGRDEVISLKHEAHSKSVFAVGSVNAAVFLKNKEHGLYEMGDMLAEV